MDQSYEAQVHHEIQKAKESCDAEKYLYYTHALSQSAVACYESFRKSQPVAYQLWLQTNSLKIRNISLALFHHTDYLQRVA